MMEVERDNRTVVSLNATRCTLSAAYIHPDPLMYMRCDSVQPNSLIPLLLQQRWLRNYGDVPSTPFHLRPEVSDSSAQKSPDTIKVRSLSIYA